MPIKNDFTTEFLNLPLPDPLNSIKDDCTRIGQALSELDNNAKNFKQELANLADIVSRITPAWNTEVWLTVSGNWTVPETGFYNVLLVGGGAMVETLARQVPVIFG